MYKTCRYILFLLAVSFSGAALAHDPVIMIPGMGGTPANMEPMKSDFVQNGWDTNRVFTWTDADQMNKDMEVSAAAIGTKVDSVLGETGASKVVLITWSASTIAGRYYMKNLGGTSKVSQFISIAGPHHGISIWEQCMLFQTACREQWGPIPNTPWLNELNSGTEVPGSPTVKYLTVRGSADTNATPVDTAMLEGADENYLAQGQDHFSIITDPTTLAKIRSFIIEHEDSGSGGGGGGDTTPPSVAITAPSDGDTVSGTVSVTATASDDTGVTWVDFYINGNLVATDTTAPYAYSWDTTSAPNGAHTIKAKAYDAANNVGIDDSTTVTVSNGESGGGGLFCGSASNLEHKNAGRAHSWGVNPYNPYYANGSLDFLGNGDATVSVLKETTAGHFVAVSSCP